MLQRLRSAQLVIVVDLQGRDGRGAAEPVGKGRECSITGNLPGDPDHHGCSAAPMQCGVPCLSDKHLVFVEDVLHAAQLLNAGPSRRLAQPFASEGHLRWSKALIMIAR